MAVIPLPPKLWSHVWFGGVRRIVIHTDGTSIVTIPADIFDKYVRRIHQGNLENAAGEREWRVE